MSLSFRKRTESSDPPDSVSTTSDWGSASPVTSIPVLPEAEFNALQDLFERLSGIRLPKEKNAMVAGRLARRLRHYGLRQFADYLAMVSDPANRDETQWMVDLLTTHETYFFREPKHFSFLHETILRGWPAGRPFRVWSAACSSGEEPYSVAMVLADLLGNGPWEIVASDIARNSLETARTGLYPIERAAHIPPEYLRRYCRKGVRAYEGSFLVARELRERIQFRQIGLNQELPDDLGTFDVVLLRNVMIYFDQKMKKQLVHRVVARLNPGGWLMVGHAESLAGVCERIAALREAPAVYRTTA